MTGTIFWWFERLGKSRNNSLECKIQYRIQNHSIEFVFVTVTEVVSSDQSFEKQDLDAIAFKLVRRRREAIEKEIVSQQQALKQLYPNRYK